MNSSREEFVTRTLSLRGSMTSSHDITLLCTLTVSFDDITITLLDVNKIWAALTL